MTKLLNTLVYVQGGEKVVTANNSYGGQTLILGNLTVSYAGQNTTVTGATTIAPNATLSFTATAATGYTLPSEIAVTIDGATAMVTTDYTWDSATGVGQILANKIVGNVVVTVVGVASGGGYSVTFDLNCYSSSGSTYYTIDGGSNWVSVDTFPSNLTDVQTIQFRMNGVGMDIGSIYIDNNEFFTPNYSSTTDSNVYILTANILVKIDAFPD